MSIVGGGVLIPEMEVGYRPCIPKLKNANRAKLEKKIFCNFYLNCLCYTEMHGIILLYLSTS
jgi:hypothetical protein